MSPAKKHEKKIISNLVNESQSSKRVHKCYPRSDILSRSNVIADNEKNQEFLMTKTSEKGEA